MSFANEKAQLKIHYFALDKDNTPSAPLVNNIQMTNTEYVTLMAGLDVGFSSMLSILNSKILQDGVPIPDNMFYTEVYMKFTNRNLIILFDLFFG